MPMLFARANLSKETKKNILKSFPVSTVVIMTSAVSPLDLKLRFFSAEVFHLTKIEKGVCLTIVTV